MKPMKTGGKWSVMTIVLLSTFMSTLDGSIVNIALPKMASSLNVDTSQIQLVATSYLIVIAAIVLIFGRLGDMLGKSRMFTAGVGLFTIGSLLCGVAGSFPVLVLARVIQAIGAAATMANNQGIITETFPPNERGKALGLLGTSVALGTLVGPGLGGLILGAAGWEYIFLINVPIGIVVFVLGFRFLPKDHKTPHEKMDGVGSLLFMLTIIPLFASLEGGLAAGFGNPLVLAGFAVAIASFLAFIRVEKRKESPLIQFQIFENKLYTLSIFCAFVTFVSIFCNNIILPFYLLDVLKYAPQQAGLMLMIYPIVLSIAAPVSGHLSDKIGSELLTFIGLMLVTLGLFAMSTLNGTSSPVQMIAFIVVMSLGMGLFQSPNNSLVMSTVPRDKLGVAGSINALVRNLGMISGITFATTLLYAMMSANLGFRVTDYVDGQSAAFIYGMRAVYLSAAAICLVGAMLTFRRLRMKN